MLVGYLLAGAAVGQGGFGLVAEDAEEIEHLAEQRPIAPQVIGIDAE